MAGLGLSGLMFSSQHPECLSGMTPVWRWEADGGFTRWVWCGNPVVVVVVGDGFFLGFLLATFLLLLGCEVVKFWSMFPVKIHVEHEKNASTPPKTNRKLTCLLKIMVGSTKLLSYWNCHFLLGDAFGMRSFSGVKRLVFFKRLTGPSFFRTSQDVCAWEVGNLGKQRFRWTAEFGESPGWSLGWLKLGFNSYIYI